MTAPVSGPLGMAKREFTVEQYVAFLSMEYEFGLRVGMELGLEIAREENADATA